MVTKVKPPDEPPGSLSDPRELAESYLDYCRDAVLRKIDGLSEVDLRTSRLPSGWAPLDLLVHLTWMERRWFRWDFAGDPMPQPWGDRTPDGRWQAPPGIPTAQLRAEYLAQCEVSRTTVATAALTDRAQPGGRFATTEEAPTLAWILFHVLYEYQRHAGHLDIARELTDNVIGE
ncbi:MAG TPA: DinB family protein [Mycobacteriales bacterium]|nr:DinB family protein [Mycobacteriales bacterium]